jgi:hypothetical protein
MQVQALADTVKLGDPHYNQPSMPHTPPLGQQRSLRGLATGGRPQQHQAQRVLPIHPPPGIPQRLAIPPHGGGRNGGGVLLLQQLQQPAQGGGQVLQQEQGSSSAGVQ